MSPNYMSILLPVIIRSKPNLTSSLFSNGFLQTHMAYSTKIILTNTVVAPKLHPDWRRRRRRRRSRRRRKKKKKKN